MKSLFLSFVVLLGGCAYVSQAPALVLYGQVVGVQAHQVVESRPNLAVAGGVVGNQFGKGNGKKAMTALGVVGGAVVGSQVGKADTVKAITDLQVRMADSTVIAVTTDEVGFKVGQSVKITQKGRAATIEAVN